MRIRPVGALILAIVIVGSAASQIVHISSADADVGSGYPYANAVCEFGASGGTHCVNPSNASDLYDWGYFSGSTFDAFDPWGYEYRNCTSYVAWRLANAGVNPALFSYLQNADDWLALARNKPGVTENSTATPGSVAVWNGPGVGHVAFVESVTGGVTVSDYNYAETGAYNPGHSLGTTPSGYIHFPGSGTGSGGSSSITISTLDSSGDFFAKSGLTGQWTAELAGASAIAVAGDATDGITLGGLDSSGTFDAKAGLGGQWTPELSGASAIAIASDSKDGVTLGAVDDSGNFYVKSGLTGPWLDESSGVRSIAIASDPSNGITLGMLSTSGIFYAKTGLTSPWTSELTGARAIALASDPTDGVTLGGLDDSGNFYAKSGLGGQWISELTGARAIALASDSTDGVTLGGLDDSGNFSAKSGLTGQWTSELTGARAIALASDSTDGVTLGGLDDSGNFFAKSGLGGQWVEETAEDEEISTGGASSATFPDPPSIGAATAGDGTATVQFVAPTWDGGSPITGYKVLSSAGSIVGSGTASPITVTGLTDGATYAFGVVATNAFGDSDASSLSNSVVPFAPIAPQIQTADQATFSLGSASSFLVTSSGTPTPSITESGQLPAGVSFTNLGNGTATIAGTPASGSAGLYAITLSASNGISPAATQSFTLTVATISITTSSLPTGSVYSKSHKVTYSATLAASGGNPPYKWSLASGSTPLPPGLKLSSAGVISGKATAPGVYPFTVQVVDTKTKKTKTTPATQNTATKTLSIIIS
jgi:surface antigen